ncbi:hypothetical protein ABT381_10555 [Streptomyces sp. NPDC000151]|uniref:hypothetical protein n=1 Tax=Streptomyces sp. NPDC000151 TaxID=3154244 RepID=UPI003317EDD2
MADDRYSWLDKNAAESLLRGERVDAGGGFGADELNDLLNAAAVAGAHPPADAPLPGEEAAAAAFRQASAGRSTRDTAAAGGAARATAEDGIPVVRSVPGGGASRTTERTRIGRPFRRGLAVALAGCALGGVAVAAGTGVLPTPFYGGHADPSPSATAAVTPSLLESQGPGADASDDAGRSPDASPDSSAPATPTSPGSSDGTPTPGHKGGGASKDPLPQLTPGGGGLGTGTAKRRAAVLALCRDYEAGRTSPGDRRRLERAVGGAEKLHALCKQYLQQNGVTGGLGGSGPTSGSGLTGGSGSTGSGGSTGSDGDSSGGDTSGGDDSSGGHESGDGSKAGDDASHPEVAPTTSPAPAPTLTATPEPTPSASTATTH